MNEFKEKLNYFNENGKKIGVVDREEGINKKLLLEAVQIWIINPKTNQVLMQRRSYGKENDPGMIDVSASGHVHFDETPTQAMVREGKEELGEKAFETIIGNMKKVMDFEIDFTKEGRKGKYITHEFLAYSTLSLEKFNKQDDEVEELFFMDYETVKNLIRNKDKEIRIPYTDSIEKLLQKLDDEIYNLKEHKESEI